MVRFQETTVQETTVRGVATASVRTSAAGDAGRAEVAAGWRRRLQRKIDRF